MNNHKLSNSDVWLKGQLSVNLPVTILVISVFLFITYFFELSLKLTVLIAFVFGWISWSFLVRNWIKWAVRNNVDEERLLKIGKPGLLVWSKNTIETVTKKNQIPWI